MIGPKREQLPETKLQKLHRILYAEVQELIDFEEIDPVDKRYLKGYTDATEYAAQQVSEIWGK